MSPQHPRLGELLAACVGDPAQVRTDTLTRRAMAHDASHVLLVPEAVVAPRSAAEVGAVMRAAAEAQAPLTFRSGGTSLSGQAGTDGVLVDVRRHFTGIEVLDGGARVRVRPGATLHRINARLARHGRRLGPDPASEIACTLGGVIANNSSGMSCGTVENSYRTLESLVAVLPSGTVVDTGAPDADAVLMRDEPALHSGLLALRERVLADPGSVATIARQFAMKNTMGYSLNALVDFERPADILAHLLVGSEGTLAFVAEATMRTVPLRPHAATALLVFPDLEAASRSLPALVATGAAALELMDATSLRVGQGQPGAPAAVRALAVGTQAALLVEYQAETGEALDELAERARPVLAGLPLEAPAVLDTDPAHRAELWRLRKGLYATVAGARRAGTTALLEDVVVPVERLADTCAALATLLERHGYADAVIFGHAKDGNLHFMLTDRFEGDEALGRYADFTEELVALILGMGGSLKAEHGTGRVMAPFVRRQYGDELYDVMREVKRLCDPRVVLGPGILLSEDPHAHLAHIKLAPEIEPVADSCVECGYCEPICPSRDLTLTPRQRIVLRREMRAAEAAGEHDAAAEIAAGYRYAGEQTCAVDSLCATSCPLGIDSGALVKELRAVHLPRPAAAGWSAAARSWKVANRTASGALDVAAVLPDPLVHGVNRAARAVLGEDIVPLWSADLPKGGERRARPAPEGPPEAVYLPSCQSAMFGAGAGPGVQAAFEALCGAAGIPLLVPDGIDSLCCGTVWSSKGATDGLDAMRARVLPVLRDATDGGRLPVVSDASSCTEGFARLVAAAEDVDVRVVDAVGFVAEHVLPALGEMPRLASLTLHPTCSSVHLGLEADLRRVAGAVAREVAVPDDWGCCAFAGDRGLLHPELTASATAPEAAVVAALGSDAHASCNRTCELGMSRATGVPYRHVLELLAERLGPTPPSLVYPASNEGAHP
ncbi:FAD-binding and (Fe-S)-binding domain-containing protein [Demequina gelatinilytica]|uniref:FAD-binding and (Fe-S)-binding domain-containing protein n=1 Tax=Demequina gelatinilytica TaxID=1638980 RepID=UPI0007856A45|nr:FAD-binding and (Fe-S)-binding domain-containing protein [Demequina gelatinilytica]